ncbi:Copper/Zinc superoxide dismutase [Fennellomyces sp. T-0311]|nr:Copper/Zinc superoxide dismutase [Fennellomyces sp. T-0311]
MVNAIAVLQGAAAAVFGYVSFHQCAPGETTTILANLTGVPAGKHGLHVHQFGDLSNGCDSLGGHYNPFNKTHGGPDDEIRHVGDFGNVEVDESGNAIFRLNMDNVNLIGPHSILGRGVVLHAGEDDLGRGDSPDSKTTGNAGARLACGVIGFPNTQ